MKGGCLKVYLALILLIVLVAIFPYKEGFALDDVMGLSWFTTKQQDVSGVYLDDKGETKGTSEKKGETKGISEIKGEMNKMNEMNETKGKHVFNDNYGLAYTDIPYDVSYNQYKFNN
jgi:hypothetical protein